MLSYSIDCIDYVTGIGNGTFPIPLLQYLWLQFVQDKLQLQKYVQLQKQSLCQKYCAVTVTKAITGTTYVQSMQLHIVLVTNCYCLQLQIESLIVTK